VRDRRINGAKFGRQHPIGPYFADFACVSERLVNEIDGEHHAYQADADARRTAMMESLGWRVMRFWANEVIANPDGIWAEIEQVTKASVTPHPTSPPNGGEEYER
jgi:very-short-patch-repair endonuclease